MKKRVLSMLMTLALCLTLFPAPAWAAEDTPEGGAIVQEEQEEATPTISEQAAENGIAVQDGGGSTVENAVAEVNPDCPVCSAENADLSACKGTEQAISLMAAAADHETISGSVTWENRNITTPVTVKGDTTITLKGENSIYQPATETTDKYDIDDDGTKDTVYEISNAGQLYWFAGLVNGTLDGVEQNTLANAILTANITVNENLLDSLQYDTEGNVSNGSDFITWTPIADWMGNRTTQYSGTFDGNNKTVSGLYFNGDSTCIGLFGSSEADGNIKMLELLIPISRGIILWAVCVDSMTAQSQTVIMQGILPLLSHLLL